MASRDGHSKKRTLRRRHADSGFFDSNCSGGEIPSPDSEHKLPQREPKVWFLQFSIVRAIQVCCTCFASLTFMYPCNYIGFI